MTQRPWTMNELKVLRLFAGLGVKGVAALLNRSQASVEAAARQSQISLRCTGDDIEIGDEVLNLIERIRETPRLQICPMCGHRWATMKETGMCRPCHLDRLISLHQEAAEVELKERALAAARKEKQRRLGDRP